MKRSFVRAARIATGIGTSLGAAVGGQALVNYLLSRSGEELSPEIPGRTFLYDWRIGQVCYTRLGDGPPLLLVHSPGAGSSSYEWREVVEPLSRRFQVYALDLIGYGLSDRPAMSHSSRLYVQLLDDFIRFVIKRQANVIAGAHAALWAIRLSHTRPERIRSVVGVCPPSPYQEPPSEGQRKLGALLNAPIVGESLYHALVSYPSTARMLREEIYADPGKVTNPVIEHVYRAAHRKGSRCAVASFIRGDLDLDVRQELKELKQPLLAVWGTEAKLTPPSAARLYQEASSRVTVHLLQDAGQLPQVEKPEEFTRLVESWLAPITSDQVLSVLA